NIQADAAAAVGARIITAVATAGSLQAETRFRLVLKEAPAVLRLAVPDEIRINQHGQNELPVRIARDRFTGPVTIRLQGDMDEVSPQEFTIPAESEQGEMTLVARDAPTGTREIDVVASGHGVRAEQSLLLTVEGPVGAAGPQWSWRLVFVIGIWTALLALGLSLAVVMGQNRYVARPWLSPGEFAALA